MANHGFFNCAFDGGYQGGQFTTGPSTVSVIGVLDLSAGYIQANTNNGISLLNVNVWNDTILKSTTASIYMSGSNSFQNVAVDSTTVVMNGVLDAKSNAGVIYGAGTLNASYNGTIAYSSTQTAVTTFPLTGGLQVCGISSNLCCNTLANPSVENCGISLTPSHLDTGSCSATTGFSNGTYSGAFAPQCSGAITSLGP